MCSPSFRNSRGFTRPEHKLEWLYELIHRTWLNDWTISSNKSPVVSKGHLCAYQHVIILRFQLLCVVFCVLCVSLFSWVTDYFQFTSWILNHYIKGMYRFFLYVLCIHLYKSKIGCVIIHIYFITWPYTYTYFTSFFFLLNIHAYMPVCICFHYFKDMFDACLYHIISLLFYSHTYVNGVYIY